MISAFTARPVSQSTAQCIADWMGPGARLAAALAEFRENIIKAAKVGLPIFVGNGANRATSKPGDCSHIIRLANICGCS